MSSSSEPNVWLPEQVVRCLDTAPLVVTPDMSLVDARAAMRGFSSEWGSKAEHAVVADGEHIIGVLSERDLVSHLPNADCRTTLSVGEVVTPVDLLMRDRVADVKVVLELMRDRDLDCVPVADERGRLFGLLSHRCLLEAIADEFIETRNSNGDLERQKAVQPDSCEMLEQRVRQRTVSLERTNAKLQREIRDRRQVEQSLRESESRYRLLAHYSKDLIARLAPDRTYTYVSPACQNLLGFSPDELLGRHLFDLFHPEDKAAWECTIAAVGQLPDVYTLSYRARCKDGSYVWLETISRTIRAQDEARTVREIVAVSRDITARKQAEAELRRYEEDLEQTIDERTRELKEANQNLTREIERRQRIERSLFREKELAQITLRSIGDAVVATNPLGYIEYLNPVAEELTGWPATEAVGNLLTEVFQLVDETTRTPIANPIDRVIREGPIVGLAEQTLLIARDRTERAVEDSIAPIRDRDGRPIGVVMVLRDVTHSRQLARRLSWQATHDELTGLVNRRAFEQYVDTAIASARERGDRHILCFLDLDRFKVVNDTCGHAAGDELLRQIADLFRQQVRASDIVARFGGDEFGLLLYRCSVETARRITTSINQALQALKFAWEDKLFSTSASIGLVAIDADSQDLATIVSMADAACYAAKDGGRNRIHIYQSGDRELTERRDRGQWVTRIHRGLAEHRFRLFAQSITPVDSARRATAPPHYEILLRMVDEAGALVLPMAFIPAVERYNLMPELDRWVIRTFFTRYWTSLTSSEIDNSDRGGEFAINLSGASLNDDRFFDFLKDQFQQYPIAPETICFEITETAAIANLSKAARFIEDLKQLGCSFALDDFGSGMSSFAYLKHLPVDYLKIDGNFVRDIVTDPLDCAIVESVHQIGSIMGIQTIAECVENDAILHKLSDIGVDFAQGIGIARPSPLVFPQASEDLNTSEDRTSQLAR
ncbi:MAG: EAL domain-containing protein [Cyanobacteria bacterium P01_D01_bin.123]